MGDVNDGDKHNNYMRIVKGKGFHQIILKLYESHEREVFCGEIRVSDMM
jgi:hypothetical protein